MGVVAVVIIASGVTLAALEPQPKEAGVGVRVAEKPLIPKPAQVADPTAGWKVYRNEQYGFEMRYPSNWHPLPDFGGSQSLVFSNEPVGAPLELSKNGFMIALELIPVNGLAFKVWADATPRSPGGTKISDRKEMIVDGLPALFQFEDSRMVEGTEPFIAPTLYIVRGQQLFIMRGFLGWQPRRDATFFKSFDRIASSLRFL